MNTDEPNAVIGVTLSSGDVHDLDRLAIENDHSRSSYARSLIRKALKAERAKARRSIAAEPVPA